MLFFFAKSSASTFHPGFRPYTRAYIKSSFKHKDSNGHYQLNSLTGSGTRQGESGDPWRGYCPTDKGRHWAVPKSLQVYLPDNGDSMGCHEKLEHLYQVGMIVFPNKPGGQPRYKQYVGSGVPYQDLWAYQPNTKGTLHHSDENIDEDVRWLENEPEKVGYPTQKPTGLLDRIIASSTNPDEMVLDPFCGCATACVSAHQQKRQWAGIDVSPVAYDLVKQRLSDLGGLFYNLLQRTDVPLRTDLGPLPKYNSTSNKNRLYGEQGGYCAGCGTHFEPQHLTIDHIIAKNSGGTDHIDNLQLLCHHCNAVKGDRGMEYLMVKLGNLSG